jgi:hypothetical protein
MGGRPEPAGRHSPVRDDGDAAKPKKRGRYATPTRPKRKRTPEELVAVQDERFEKMRLKHNDGIYARKRRELLASQFRDGEIREASGDGGGSGTSEIIGPGQSFLANRHRDKTEETIARLASQGLRDGSNLLLVPSELSDLFRESVEAGLRYTIITCNTAAEYIRRYARPDSQEEPPLLYGKVTEAAREMVKFLLRAQTQTDSNALMAAKDDDLAVALLQRVRGPHL